MVNSYIVKEDKIKLALKLAAISVVFVFPTIAFAQLPKCEDVAHDFVFYQSLESICHFEGTPVSQLYGEIARHQNCQKQLGKKFNAIATGAFKAMHADVKMSGEETVCTRNSEKYYDLQKMAYPPP